MRRISIIAILFLLTTTVYGQDYYEKFKKLLTDKDSAGLKSLLSEWEKRNSDDPELYTSYFNYYVQKSMNEVIRVDDNPGTGEHLQITDSLNQVVGYIRGQTTYNPKYLNLAFEVLDKGMAIP